MHIINLIYHYFIKRDTKIMSAIISCCLRNNIDFSIEFKTASGTDVSIRYKVPVDDKPMEIQVYVGGEYLLWTVRRSLPLEGDDRNAISCVDGDAPMDIRRDKALPKIHHEVMALAFSIEFSKSPKIKRFLKRLNGITDTKTLVFTSAYRQAIEYITMHSTRHELISYRSETCTHTFCSPGGYTMDLPAKETKTTSYDKGLFEITW